jgi:hypothetical protein
MVHMQMEPPGPSTTDGVAIVGIKPRKEPTKQGLMSGFFKRLDQITPEEAAANAAKNPLLRFNDQGVKVLGSQLGTMMGGKRKGAGSRWGNCKEKPLGFTSAQLFRLGLMLLCSLCRHRNALCAWGRGAISVSRGARGATSAGTRGAFLSSASVID